MDKLDIDNDGQIVHSKTLMRYAMLISVSVTSYSERVLVVDPYKTFLLYPHLMALWTENFKMYYFLIFSGPVFLLFLDIL